MIESRRRQAREKIVTLTFSRLAVLACAGVLALLIAEASVRLAVPKYDPAGHIAFVRLPMNFNSPYKANNIIDFWRRWHMTLSRFIRDYLYVPLGGNRNGNTRRYVISCWPC